MEQIELIKLNNIIPFISVKFDDQLYLRIALDSRINYLLFYTEESKNEYKLNIIDVTDSPIDTLYARIVKDNEEHKQYVSYYLASDNIPKCIFAFYTAKLHNATKIINIENAKKNKDAVIAAIRKRLKNTFATLTGEQLFSVIPEIPQLASALVNSDVHSFEIDNKYSVSVKNDDFNKQEFARALVYKQPSFILFSNRKSHRVILGQSLDAEIIETL